MTRNKVISFALFFIVSTIICMGFVHSEIWLFTDTTIDNQTQTVDYHGYYQIDDTSPSVISTVYPIDINLRSTVEPLPYNITSFGHPEFPNAIVDWCNYTIVVANNQFEFTNKNVINTTYTTYNYYFTNTGVANATSFYFQLKQKDYIVADMICHYTDVNSLFIDNVLIGKFSVYFPSYECNQCANHDFEELSQANQQSAIDNQTQQTLSIYSTVQNVIGWNYSIWIYVVWILKIGLVIGSLSLIFAGIIYIYKMFQSAGRVVR